jgi:hypothetical protein
MEFNNKLQPKVDPRQANFEEMMEKFSELGLVKVRDVNGDYFSYTDPNTGVELFNAAFTPQNFKLFSEALNQGIPFNKALSQRAKQEKAAMPKPEFTETVTPLSYNEKGGVATENKPSMVRKIK